MWANRLESIAYGTFRGSFKWSGGSRRCCRTSRSAMCRRSVVGPGGFTERAS